jgi:hypothetical protein
MLIDIQPFLTYIRAEYLNPSPNNVGHFQEGAVFAISTVAGQAPSFNIMVNETSVFSNISAAALSNSRPSQKFDDDDYNFYNCPESDASVVHLDYLTNINSCAVWRRDKGFWQKGNYLFTLDFPNANQQLQLIELEDGNYIFWDNSLITWGEGVIEKLPNYEED